VHWQRLKITQGTDITDISGTTIGNNFTNRYKRATNIKHRLVKTAIIWKAED
jgi:hypothetical protein